MAKQNEPRKFEPLPINNQSNLNISNNNEGPPTRICIDLEFDYNEKLEDFCYADGSSKKDTVKEILTKFLDSVNPPQRPEKVRNKTKTGRKPKN